MYLSNLGTAISCGRSGGTRGELQLVLKWFKCRNRNPEGGGLEVPEGAQVAAVQDQVLVVGGARGRTTRHPWWSTKGCKVRTSVNTQGSKKKEDKRGQEKIKRTTRSNEMRLALAGHRQRQFINNWNAKPAAQRSQYKQNHNIIVTTTEIIIGS